jgi:phage baseplate assembly protein V
VTGEIMRYIQRLFEHHARKMRNIVARGEVAMVQDGPKMQTNQIRLLDGELIDGAERAQQYGFTSHPRNGAECFVVFAGAGREHPIILSVDDRRYRVKSSKPGEVVIYTDEGDRIALKRDNTIEVTTKHYIVKAEEDVLIETLDLRLRGLARISLETPNLSAGGFGEGEATTAQFKGDLNQDGSHTSTGDQVAGGVSQINHPHRDAGGTGNSGPPIAGG